jgi:hypothetical protein
VGRGGSVGRVEGEGVRGCMCMMGLMIDIDWDTVKM